MEIKEALECIWVLSIKETNRHRREAFELAVPALEKQIPKKLLQACGHATELFKKDIPSMEYCPICGQRLDWRE